MEKPFFYLGKHQDWAFLKLLTFGNLVLRKAWWICIVYRFFKTQVVTYLIRLTQSRVYKNISSVYPV